MITKFRIDRQTWYRGKGSDESYLLNDSGKMCCLGFFCLEDGLDANDIENKRTPFSLGSYAPSQLNNTFYHKICTLMSLNDSETISDTDREQELKQEFLKLEPPVEVEFYN